MGSKSLKKTTKFCPKPTNFQSNIANYEVPFDIVLFYTTKINFEQSYLV